jgi:hypothetical protein
MVLPYLDGEDVPEEPPYCCCSACQYQRRGRYFRKVAQVWAYFFCCRHCRTHITLLPTRCVPYKHYPARDIERVLSAVTTSLRTVHAIDRRERPGISRSTMYNWAREWRLGSSLLASLGMEKIGVMLSGTASGIYQKLSQWYGEPFLSRLQADLCRSFPPLGLFRPLIRLSDSGHPDGHAFSRKSPPGAGAKS